MHRGPAGASQGSLLGRAFGFGVEVGGGKDGVHPVVPGLGAAVFWKTQMGRARRTGTGRLTSGLAPTPSETPPHLGRLDTVASGFWAEGDPVGGWPRESRHIPTFADESGPYVESVYVWVGH
jgi:hypothetical protein